MSDGQLHWQGTLDPPNNLVLLTCGETEAQKGFAQGHRAGGQAEGTQSPAFPSTGPGRDLRGTPHRNAPQGCSLFVRLLVACGIKAIPQVSLLSTLGLGVDSLQDRLLGVGQHDKLVFSLCWACKTLAWCPGQSG